MKPRTLMAVLGIACALALSAATSAKADVGGNNWTVTVLSPTPYQIVTTPYLPIKVVANNYELDARYAGTLDLPDIGHYHEILDGRLIDMTPTRNPTNDQISMMGVVPGLHVLTIVPAHNDHSMIMTSAVMVPFYYEGPFIPLPTCTTCSGSPTIAITSPGAGMTVRGISFVMSVDVTNFMLSGPCYGKNLVDGVGHWHVFADMPMMANMLTMANNNSQQVYTIGLTPGWHIFFAVLVNNQHMPFMDPNTGMLVPGTFASISLLVNGSD